MKAPLSLAVCIALTCQAAVAAEPAGTKARWVSDASGCKFLNPAPPEVPSFTITWTGGCVDGFVSGQGEVRAGSWLVYRGEFAQGRIVKGTAENNGAVYEGGFLDNLPNGAGMSRTAEGLVTKGTFTRGAIDPAAVEMTWANNMRYRGAIDPRTRYMQGRGVLEYGDGSVYEGEFNEDRVEGEGVMKRPNGEVRRGKFIAGRQEGKGSVLYANQARYEGELRADQPSGEGRMEWADGSLYEGTFVAGSYQGRGKMTYADGSRYEGEFLAGATSGTGTMTYPDGTRYEGQFLYGRRHGTGRAIYAAGHVEEGEWKGGVLSGKCRVTKDEVVYDGHCIAGKATGIGRLEDKPKNLVYEGEFLKDQFEGKGSLRSGDVVYDGMFKAGLMEGPGTLRLGKVTMKGEFRAGSLVRGTVNAQDGRTYEVDLDKSEVLEVLKDGTKRPVDQLPPDITI